MSLPEDILLAEDNAEYVKIFHQPKYYIQHVVLESANWYIEFHETNELSWNLDLKDTNQLIKK